MPTDSLRRRIRLQISLRTLLVLMAAVGVGLAIFRWPWVETTQHEVWSEPVNPIDMIPYVEPHVVYRYERRTTYRRNWRGVPEKNGLEQLWRDGRVWHEVHYYDGELHGQQRAFGKDGKLRLVATYRDGKLNGPFRAGDGATWVWEGSYRENELHGPWRVLVPRQSASWMVPPRPDDWVNGHQSVWVNWADFPPPADPIVVFAQWEQGKRHSRWRWQSLAGEPLNTAEFAHEALTHWNGEPVVEQFWHWLRTSGVPDEQVVALEAADREESWEISSYGHSLPIIVERRHQAGVRIPVYIDPSVPGGVTQFFDRRQGLGSALCELAAHNGYVFDFRYGAIWLVPAGKSSRPFVDPTGVSEIQFPAGSDEEREWNAEVEIKTNGSEARHFARDLFAGTYLRVVDVSTNVDKYGEDTLARRWAPTRTLIGSRRNALGILLYRAGYRCELRNGKLCIFPQAE